VLQKRMLRYGYGLRPLSVAGLACITSPASVAWTTSRSTLPITFHVSIAPASIQEYGVYNTLPVTFHMSIAPASIQEYGVYNTLLVEFHMSIAPASTINTKRIRSAILICNNNRICACKYGTIAISGHGTMIITQITLLAICRMHTPQRLRGLGSSLLCLRL
jgi:hypothetical protein